MPMWTPEEAVPEAVRQRFEALGKLGPDASPKMYMMGFLEIVSRLKHSERTGWVDRSLPKPESIADHMYRMAIICFFNESPDIDVAKCQQIALVHDMAEALVGDITPYDPDVDKTEKHRREQATMEYLRDIVAKFNPRAAKQIFDLWCEYEYQTSPEANFVKDIDKFELASQCSEYMREYPQVELADIRRVNQLVKGDEVKEWNRHLQAYDDLTSE